MTVAIWQMVHSNIVEYNCCPTCHALFSALDEGLSKTGKSQQISYVNRQKDLDYRSRFEGSIEYRDHHYQTWKEKTTDTYQHSLDHRSCALCGYKWDISVLKKIDSQIVEV